MRIGPKFSASARCSQRKRSSLAWFALACAVMIVVGAPAWAGPTKTISGKLHSVKGNVLTVEKKVMGRASLVEIEMDEHTKVSGEIAQGWDAKIKYREEPLSGSGHEVRRVAMEVQTQPHMASKAAKEAVKQTPPSKKDQP